VGGQRIARLVEALSGLPCESLPPYTSEIACSLSMSSLDLAEARQPYPDPSPTLTLALTLSPALSLSLTPALNRTEP
jgi:hypothetical protein